MQNGRLVKAMTLGKVLLCILWVIICASGCRAISRYSESRQTIAARRLSRQGLEAMHEGQWDVAEGLFAGALDITAADDRAHWGLAESLWQRGEREAALEHMEQAVRLSAADPRLLRRLAKMYLDLGRLPEAERQVSAAMEADRESAEVWALRGDCLLKHGDHIGALSAYHRAMAIQPDYPEVQLQAAEIYRIQGRHDRLLATVDRLQESLGSDQACPARGRVLRGIALFHLDRPAEAQQCFAEVIKSNPLLPDPHLSLAELHLQRGEIVEARFALDQAMLLDPDSQVGMTLSNRLQEIETRMAASIDAGSYQR